MSTAHATSSFGLARAGTGGVLLGIGMGALLDGIVFHQLLQWHSTMSSLIPPTTLEAMQVNTRWDGVFQAAAWLATLAGIFLVWTGAVRAPALPSAGWLLGLMMAGWGLFNFTEGLIAHHVLDIHHVRGWAPDSRWDYGYLLSGPILVGLGWLLARRADPPP